MKGSVDEQQRLNSLNSMRAKHSQPAMACLCLVLMLMVPAAVISQPASEAEAIDSLLTRSVRVSTGESPPFTGRQLPGKGRVARVISAAFAKSGLSVEFVFMPWKRAYHASITGEVDGTAYWYESSERSVDHFYSEPITYEQGLWIHLKARPLHWGQLQDLAGLRIGAVTGYTYTPEFYQAVKNGALRVTFVANTRQLLNMLLAGRIDTYNANPEVVAELMQKNFTQQQRDKITHHPKPLLTTTSHVLFPRGAKLSKELLWRFNHGLAALRSSGELDLLLSGAAVQKSLPVQITK